MICFLKVHVAHSDTLLTAFADQLLYNFSLVKLCSACATQNAAVKTPSDGCSSLAKQTLSDPVGQCPSPSLINFEKVLKSVLV